MKSNNEFWGERTSKCSTWKVRECSLLYLPTLTNVLFPFQVPLPIRQSHPAVSDSISQLQPAPSPAPKPAPCSFSCSQHVPYPAPQRVPCSFSCSQPAPHFFPAPTPWSTSLKKLNWAIGQFFTAFTLVPILKRQLMNMKLMYHWGSQTPCPNIAFCNKLNLNKHFLFKILGRNAKY